MSGRRLVVTTAAMAAVAVALRALTPDLSALTVGGLDLQRVADTAGAETLLLAAAAAGAWLAWAWGALGLVLTALSALPGVAGAAAGVLLRRVLPASARHAAALALGVGLAAAPALTGCTTPPAPAVTTMAVLQPSAVPDWPAPGSSTAPAPPAALPDWPAPAPGDHVVLRGECLWSIAAADLRDRTGTDPTDAEVATAVGAWWAANAAVIGDDPDLLLPGQVLRPPA
jgi:nucleoid-associated protein YgaU